MRWKRWPKLPLFSTYLSPGVDIAAGYDVEVRAGYNRTQIRRHGTSLSQTSNVSVSALPPITGVWLSNIIFSSSQPCVSRQLCMCSFLSVKCRRTYSSAMPSPTLVRTQHILLHNGLRRPHPKGRRRCCGMYNI